MARYRRQYNDDYNVSDYSRDVADIGQDYSDDWSDRFDDAEGSVRNAFSGLLGNRRTRRGRGYDMPPRAARRPVSAERILEQAGFYEIVDKIEELSKKVDELSKA